MRMVDGLVGTESVSAHQRSQAGGFGLGAAVNAAGTTETRSGQLVPALNSL